MLPCPRSAGSAARRPGRIQPVSNYGEIRERGSSISEYAAVIQHYARMARKYDRRWGRYCQQTLSAALGQLELRGDEELLDVACGTGLLGQMVRDRWPGIRLTGVDLSPDMLAIARQRLPEADGVHWRVGSAESLAFRGQRFDMVTCTNAFHLVADQRAALAEFQRVLKPGGALVLVDWCRDYAGQRLLSAASRGFERQKRRVLRLKGAEALLEEGGFLVSRSHRFRARRIWGMFCVLARKPAAAPAPPERDWRREGGSGQDSGSRTAAGAGAPVETSARRSTDTPAV